MNDEVDRLRGRIESDLREAMRVRDDTTMRTLRTLLGTLDNASAVAQTAEHQPTFGHSAEVPRRCLSMAETQVLIQSEADERRHYAAEYARLDQAKEADRLNAELAVLSRYLLAKT